MKNYLYSDGDTVRIVDTCGRHPGCKFVIERHFLTSTSWLYQGDVYVDDSTVIRSMFFSEKHLRPISMIEKACQMVKDLREGKKEIEPHIIRGEFGEI